VRIYPLLFKTSHKYLEAVKMPLKERKGREGRRKEGRKEGNG
jgi:hypothetical protein